MAERECAQERRRYRSRAEAEELAAEFEASGLTQREFCERRGVAVNTLVRYVKRYRQQRAETAGTPRWVAVEIAESGPGTIRSGLWVELGGGRRIEVGRRFDEATLRQLVAALERG